MYMKPSDDDMTYKEPRNPDDSSVAISGSNSSEMRLPENKNNPKQIASTGKGKKYWFFFVLTTLKQLWMSCMGLGRELNVSLHYPATGTRSKTRSRLKSNLKVSKKS